MPNRARHGRLSRRAARRLRRLVRRGMRRRSVVGEGEFIGPNGERIHIARPDRKK